MPMNNRLMRPRQSGYVAKDADARTYIAAVESADNAKLEDGVRRAIDNFVAGCKTDGIWTAIKASCILMGARTLSGALTALVGTAPTNNGPFVSGDYDRKTGLVGNGSTKWLASGRLTNDDPQNSHHLSVYASAIDSRAANRFYIGNTFAVGWSAIYGVSASTANVSLTSRTSAVSASATAVTGFMGVSRAASGSYVSRVNQTNATTNETSQTPGSGAVSVFANSTGGERTTARLAFYSIGENLTLASLDTRISTLYTAIGAAIK